MSNSDFQRWVREYNREVDRVNRENKRRIDDYNRRVDRENKRRVDEYNRQARHHNDGVRRQAERANRENFRVITDYNRQVDRVNQHNRKVDVSQKATIAELTRPVNANRYSPEEEQLAQRVAEIIAAQDAREWDVFLSYAQIDGAKVGRELCARLEALAASKGRCKSIGPARRFGVSIRAAELGQQVRSLLPSALLPSYR
ncbi:MAG: hypothetical protein ACRDTK_01980 [Mycobacterium sp.]